MSQRAQRLLRVELGDEYRGGDYDELISNKFYGYTHFYSHNSVITNPIITNSWSMFRYPHYNEPLFEAS